MIQLWPGRNCPLEQYAGQHHRPGTGGGYHATTTGRRSQHQHSILGHINFMYQYHMGNR